MSLAEIQRKITSDAEREAAMLLARAREQAVAIRDEAEKTIHKTEEQYSDHFRKEEPEILRRRNIVADLDIQRIALGEKQKLVESAFSGALEKLRNLPRDRYLDFTEKLLDKAVETGEEELILSPSEGYIDQKWVDEYNEKKGKSLVVSDHRTPMAGGFILRRGDIQTNCSWDMLLRWIRDDIEADVAQRLFPE